MASFIPYKGLITRQQFITGIPALDYLLGGGLIPCILPGWLCGCELLSGQHGIVQAIMHVVTGLEHRVVLTGGVILMLGL